eukprot:883787-Prorocentrum_minimum.AAC.1
MSAQDLKTVRACQSAPTTRANVGSHLHELPRAKKRVGSLDRHLEVATMAPAAVCHRGGESRLAS